ncbi:hypothetical protein [Streptomyces griseorubiginosus]|uniref:hypothetical protein n=1 Tax=Streptomyces griseorubiginosus TaxID=67304 RepID=UPI00340BBDA4
MVKDVRGTWRLKQSNGPLVTLNINEDPDGTFAGNSTAQFDGITGTIDDARATDSEITFRVPWSNGPVGRYTGRFDFQGRLTGITFAEGHPDQQATWVVDEKTFGPMQ